MACVALAEAADNGISPQAEAAFSETLDAAREAAVSSPGDSASSSAYLEVMVETLTNWGVALKDAGRKSEAVEKLQEAVNLGQQRGLATATDETKGSQRSSSTNVGHALVQLASLKEEGLDVSAALPEE